MPPSGPTGGPCASPPWPSCQETSLPAAPGSGSAPSGLALRAGDGRGPATAAARRVPAQLGTPRPRGGAHGIYTGTLPYARLFELARVLLDAAAEGDAPARQAADVLADEIAAFVRAAVVRLDLHDDVEVVLGGGIFDTDDAGFHARVAAGIRAAAPAPLSSASTRRPSSVPPSSGSMPMAPPPAASAALRRHCGRP